MEAQIMSSNVVDEVIEKMAIAIAADHISVEDRSVYSWDAADDVFRRSFRQNARRYLEAGLLGLAHSGDTIAPSAITEVEQLADSAEKAAVAILALVHASNCEEAAGQAVENGLAENTVHSRRIGL
jgi:hypothetical protein